jgi:Tol biopolymer transport system component
MIMSPKTICIGILLFIISLFSSLSQQGDFPALKGPYLGQKPPGMTPEIFAPGIISTGMSEFASAFSPDGYSFFYNNSSGPVPVLLCMQQINGIWTEPEVASFSGRFRDYDPSFSFDGTKLFFSSDRPLKEGEKIQDTVDIWMIEKIGNGWSQPVNLGGKVNSRANEYYPCATKNGNLYFSSGRQGGSGGNDVYVCRFVDGQYLSPENVGDNINSSNFEGDTFVAPDESYMIVTCYNRSDGFGSGDLYISFRDKDGGWSKLKNMGNVINSYANEHCPRVTPDGKYFFFTSYRNNGGRPLLESLTFQSIITIQLQSGNGKGDIYWVDAKIIEDLKSKE